MKDLEEERNDLNSGDNELVGLENLERMALCTCMGMHRGKCVFILFERLWLRYVAN